ncbi:hypothetical protein TTHERM_00329830 (macronuclear) [Tetrahymena thermophila SB210]|uniref:Uncharacterized protein n=1 Tax=Tetrahymena thermophila (strain SB210) TaxID=312017 RepID=I7LXW1_TETTS|nr:hypothetical protein TTHERM_00329830 [Tetrahymena thermophila SB210]EAS06303.2 hypothetical protein TTHERM_00329830 [Tetrahymena thermophila SB210]|eukprot:XP_001026548.2 hypothetical protein TTHERM_00329830 [Tetrahymena thermophila SB210]
MRSSFKSQSRNQVQYIKKEALQDDKTPKYEEVKISQVKINEASTYVQKESQPIIHSNNSEQVSKPSDKPLVEQSNNLEQDSTSQQRQQKPDRANNNNNNNQQQRKQGQRNNRHFKTTYVPKKLLQSEIDQSQAGQESNKTDSQTQSNQGQSNNLNESQEPSNNLQMNGRQSLQGNGTNTQKYRYNYRNGSVQPKNERYSQGGSSQIQNQTKSSLFYQLKSDQTNATNEGNQFEDSPQKNQKNFQRDNLRKSEKEPKTTQKKDYAQIQAMLKRQNDNMIARNNRRNHSIVRTPDAHLLLSCNWDGIENVEQSYELLQKKSQDVSSFCQQENSTSQAFPSLLDDSSRLSKFAPSSLRPSRKASISSSETNPQDLTNQIHQIAQELQQNQEQQVEKPVHVHDIQALQEVKQEAIMESEEFNYKEEEKTKQAKSTNATPSSKENKKNNQRQSNKIQRESINKGRKSNTIIYVRKENVQKEQTPSNQMNQKKSVVYEEKVEVVEQQQPQQIQQQQQQQQQEEKEYPDILNDIEFEMDLEINPTQQTRRNQNKNQRQERDLQNANFDGQLIAEQQQADHESEQNKKDSSNSQDHNENEVYPRISNLDEYVPVQFTAEQQEAFEKGEYQELQKEIDQFQKQDQQIQNECREENQREISSDVILQQKEEEDFVQIEEEGLASKISCQSPPPTENLTQQDVDAALEKFEEENQNQHHLSKFGQQYETDLEQKVLEQLQKKHIIEQNAEQVDENNKSQTITENKTDDQNSNQIIEKNTQEQDNKNINGQQKELVEEEKNIKNGIENVQTELTQEKLTVIDNQANQSNNQMQYTANIVIEENEIQEAFNHFQQEHQNLASKNEEENVEIITQKQKSQDKREEEVQQQLEEEEEVQQQFEEEVEIFVSSTEQTRNHNQNKQERDLQSHNGQQLDDHFKQEEQAGNQNQSSPSKNEKQVKEQKTIDELDKQCEYFNANSNYSSDKQNNTQTQDDTSSAKHIEMNGFLLEVQSDRNFDDSNHDLNSEYPKTEAPYRRKTRFLQQFSDNLKDIGKNNTCLVNSLGSNIVTTFAGYVCNKIVTSTLLKNGKLNHSSGNRMLFSSFSSLNSSLKN